MKNRLEFVISTTDIKEEGLTIDSELDVSMVSIKDDPALKFIDIKLLGKIRRINKSEYIFEAKVSGFCHLSCSVCLEVFKLNLDENFRVFFLPPLQCKNIKEDEFELVSRDLEVSNITSDGIDLFPSIRDHLLLSIPIQPRCRVGCKNINSTLSCSDENEDSLEIDNRWSVLKDFKLKK